MQADTAIALESEDEESEVELPTSNQIDLQPPPFAEVHDGPEYVKSAVSVELTNSNRITGTLVQFNASSETISIMEANAVTATDLEMSSVKFMRLEKPYQLLKQGATDRTP
jgi:hypothetical protein